jgi:hypothetical protein
MDFLKASANTRERRLPAIMQKAYPATSKSSHQRLDRADGQRPALESSALKKSYCKPEKSIDCYLSAVALVLINLQYDP